MKSCWGRLFEVPYENPTYMAVVFKHFVAKEGPPHKMIPLKKKQQQTKKQLPKLRQQIYFWGKKSNVLKVAHIQYIHKVLYNSKAKLFK